MLLNGIKVLDLTKLLPGPICTMHLADMGADVIKIEEIKTGDNARTIPALFLAINRNKRSIALDLTKKEGKDLFLKLSSNADVIVEGFRPGVVSKLGIDYETIKKINPKIVYCSISAYGQTGPYREKAGHDLNFCSYTGLIKKTIPNFQIADIVGGSLNAAMGILAALVYQKTSGQGQYIDVSMMDGTLAHCVGVLCDDGLSMLTGDLPCYNIYETADGRHIALAALEFKFWKNFCKAMKRDDLLSKHMVSGKDTKIIYDELSAIFKTKTLKDWQEYFKDVDCCISPVLLFQEILTNEQVLARDMIITQKKSSGNKTTQFSLPLKFDKFKFQVKRSAPTLGEHTEEVLSGLGYLKNQIVELKSRGVIA